MIKARLEAIEKELRFKKDSGPERFWMLVSHSDKETVSLIRKIEAGKIESANGGFYSPDGNNMIIIICPAKAKKGEK